MWRYWLVPVAAYLLSSASVPKAAYLLLHFSARQHPDPLLSICISTDFIDSLNLNGTDMNRSTFG